MATNANTLNSTTALTPPAAEAPKVKTVIDDMPNRRLFDTVEEAAAYLQAAQTDYPDFAGYPIAAVGLTEEGEFDPEVYTDAMRIAVSVLTQRGEGAGSSTVKAIVIYPSPRIEAIMDSAQGVEWLTGIMEKELNHVAVRQLRKAEDATGINDAIGQMPTTIEGYITSGRESTGGILESFNDLWPIIKKAIGERSKAFALANLSKKELRKAMESASYAAAVYPTLETRTNKKGDPESFFQIAALFGQTLAKQQGKDSTIFDRMLATRNEKKIEVADDEGDEDFDIAAMAAKIAATPATDSTAPTEGAETTDQPTGDSQPDAPAPTQDTDGAAS